MHAERCLRRQCAAIRRRLCLLAATALLPAAGCTTGGGNALFPNDHRLLTSALDLAANARPLSVPTRELQKQALEAYYIQPGDVLLLEVLDLEADIRLPADQTVMPDGTIDLGEYGRPVVAGMTIEQIEAVVLYAVQAVEEDQTIKPINVRLNVAESAVYYVLGEVNAPGSYPLIGRETVLDAIVTAGGLSDRASDCQIILSRPTPPSSCRIVLPVCYDRIVQLGDTTTNYQIRPGDRVFVATRTCPEALKFWNNGCPNCPECGERNCRCGVTPAQSPFLAAVPPFAPLQEPILTPAPGTDGPPALPEPPAPPAARRVPRISIAAHPTAPAKPATGDQPKVENMFKR